MTGVVEVIGAAAAAASAAAPYVAVATSLASAGLAYAGSQRQASALRQQAQQQQFAAEQEALKGRAQVQGINDALRATLAGQRARYAAAGVELTGTPDTVARETEAEAERQTTITRTNATMAAEARRIQAASLLSESSLTRQAGYLNLGFSLFSTADRALARAPGTVTPGVGATRAAAAGAAKPMTAAQADYALGPLY